MVLGTCNLVLRDTSICGQDDNPQFRCHHSLHSRLHSPLHSPHRIHLRNICHVHYCSLYGNGCLCVPAEVSCSVLRNSGCLWQLWAMALALDLFLVLGFSMTTSQQSLPGRGTEVVVSPGG